MWKVSAKSTGLAPVIGFITLVVVSCCWGEKNTAGPGKDNEFYTTFKYSPARGLGYEQGVTRRDPSDIIRAGSRYYVWYTKTTRGSSGYDAAVWYATSRDGKTWTEKSESIKRGRTGNWDAQSVFTPNVLVAEGRYYLFYTAISKPKTERFSTAIGAAVSDSPDGPWKKHSGNPILTTGAGQWAAKTGAKAEAGAAWDSHVVDDACLIVRDGKYWLYYKGRQMGMSPAQTKIGVAVSARPQGPYIKSELNPLIKSGHEVLVWPFGEGVAVLIGQTGSLKNTVQYAPDGLKFSVKAHIKDPPKAPGAYRPDAFTNTKSGKGISWGISMGSYGKWPYLVRFDCDLARKKTQRSSR